MTVPPKTSIKLKKIWIPTTLFLLLPTSLVGQGQATRGIVKEGLSIHSKILDTPQRFTVYLPFDYESSTRLYPVVYLLPGYTDNDMAWIQFGEANLIADEAISKREIPPMILVMPDGGTNWYINNYGGSIRYEDYFFQEFRPYIESTFRIRQEKRYRAVAGQSMGGFGSLVYAFRHPELFSACAALGAAVNTTSEITGMDDRAWTESWPIKIYGPASGEQRLTNHLLSYNPIRLAETIDAEKLKGVRIYLDCGDDDYLTVGNATLHITLTQRKIPHEFRVRDGAHTWSYWRSGLLDALKFIGTSFRKP